MLISLHWKCIYRPSHLMVIYKSSHPRSFALLHICMYLYICIYIPQQSPLQWLIRVYLSRVKNEVSRSAAHTVMYLKFAYSILLRLFCCVSLKADFRVCRLTVDEVFRQTKTDPHTNKNPRRFALLSAAVTDECLIEICECWLFFFCVHFLQSQTRLWLECADRQGD